VTRRPKELSKLQTDSSGSTSDEDSHCAFGMVEVCVVDAACDGSETV